MLHQPLRLTLATVVLMSLSTPRLEALEIIAHRGASREAPENTVAAMKLAWEQSADAGELDIHFTQDRQIVVIHDSNTKRTAGADLAVAAHTLDALRRLDAGSWKEPRWQGEKLPTLAEMLATIPNGKRMFIEIKCSAEVLPALEPVLAAAGKKPEQLVLIGFKYATMQQAKQRFPRHPAYWVVGYGGDKKTGEHPQIDKLIAQAKAAGLDGLDLDYKFPLDAAVVSQVKAAGLGLYVWTVDDAAVAVRLAAAGVDGITTNRPGWLRQQLAAKQP